MEGVPDEHCKTELNPLHYFNEILGEIICKKHMYTLQETSMAIHW